MKKYLFIVAYLLGAFPALAQTTLPDTLALLQLPARTEAQHQQVVRLFYTAQNPDMIFATGSSLVKTPPPLPAEPILLNIIIQGTHPLKAAFSAVILTVMGSVYEQLIPLLQEVVQSEDPLLRAYGAGAYALANPTDTAYTPDVIRLFIFDAPLAQRAMNLLAQNQKKQLAFLKKAASNADPQVRAATAAWLGTLHTQEAVQILLKRAKKETDSSVQTQLATSLAKTPDISLPATAKGLAVSYKKPTSATYALALGFMTGNSVDTLKTALLSKNENLRINALRAAAYMAGVLSNPDAFNYTTDREFDARLLKSLIAPIAALAQHGTAAEQSYAQNTLAQLEKLM